MQGERNSFGKTESPDGRESADRASVSDTDAGRRRRIPRWFVRVVLAAIVAALVYQFVDFDELGDAFATASALGLITLLLLASVDRWLMAVKWYQLAAPLPTRPRLTRFAALYYAASFINYCFPAMIGGDVYRAVGLARDCPSDRDSVFASVVMEKVVALVATLVLAWVGLAVLIVQYPGPAQRTVLFALAGGSAAAAALIAFSLIERLHDIVVRLLRRMRLEKPARLTDEMLRSYKTYSRRGRLLAGNFAWALVENATQLAIWWFAAREIGVTVSDLDLIAIVAVSQFARRAVNYVQGGAVAEVLNISLYTLVGIDPSQGLAIAVLAHASSLLASLPGVLVLFRGRRVVESAEGGHVVGS